LDLEKPEMAGMRLHAGAEFACYDHFALRGGWDQEYPSLGAGINYAGFDLDYAVSFPVLGLRHLMTLTFAFGDDMAAARAHRQNDLERQKQQVIQGLKDEMVAGYLHQANQAYGGGDLRQAVMLWEKALDWDPNNQEAKQKLQSAQEELQRRQLAASLALASQHYEAGEYLDAILECRKVLEIDPQNGQALQINARAEKQASSFGAAATTAEVQSVAKARDFYLKGLKAYTSQNWAEAVKNWDKAAEQSPLQQQITHYLDQARQHMTAAGQSLPEGLAPAPAATPVAVQKLYKEAVNLSRTGKLSDAVQTWEKLIKENPADEDAKKNLDKTRQDLIDSQKRGLKW
jgi:tetratricopeptide (TPR) repeat protein